MKTFLEFIKEEFSQGMKDWMKNNDITRKMQAREPAEAPPKPAFDRAAFDAKIADMNKKIDAEGPFITNKQSRSVHWDDKIANKINRIDIRRSAPKTVIPEPVDFTGGNSPLADPVVKSYDRGKQDRQNQELAREKKWQSVYKKPAGYGTPSYDRARDRDDAEWKSKLPANPYNDVPAEAVPGSTRPQFVDTMKTNPIVPVPIRKPKPKPPEIDQRVPRPKLRPERKPAITNKDNTKGAVAIPKPDSVGINVKPAKKTPQKRETFAQAFKRTPEGKKFTWTDPKTGKTGTYIRRTKKG